MVDFTRRRLRLGIKVRKEMRPVCDRKQNGREWKGIWLVESRKQGIVTGSRFSWSTNNLPVVKEGVDCLCSRAYWN